MPKHIRGAYATKPSNGPKKGKKPPKKPKK
jgi:hypothetical protein